MRGMSLQPETHFWTQMMNTAMSTTGGITVCAFLSCLVFIIPNIVLTVQRLKIVTHLSRQRWYEHKSDAFPDNYGLPNEWEM